MPFLRACVHYIDAFTDRSGRLLAWLALGMALVTALIVVLRYGFNIGSIAAQEAVIYMHGSLFMLGAAYALNSKPAPMCGWTFFTATSAPVHAPG
jgi:TRAP-type mannitol/chloroaromatic compound transport system permease small subunit